MESRKQLVERVKVLREEGLPWKKIQKEITKEGFTQPNGKPYTGPSLCGYLLKAYPNSRSVSEYKKGQKTSRKTSGPIDKMRLVEVIMETERLSKTEKLEVLRGILK